MAQRIRLGLIGTGIQRSKSPALHMAEGAAQGLDLSYELIDLTARGLTPEALPDLLDRAEAEGFAGLNITHPCKQQVIPLLHDLSPDARDLGAVNTVVFRDGRRTGHNTDWSGFMQGFRLQLPDVALGSVVQMGAGGAGAAVAHAVLRLGVGRLFLSDMDMGRARDLAAALNARAGRDFAQATGDVAAAMAAADGLINTTPMGMEAHPGLPIAADLIRPGHWVAEIVYFPLETQLLAVARAKGCRTADGGGMAVFQAAEAFRLFTGLAPDAARMLAHFRGLAG
ncbi:MAG: shikimate dehydrogenase [Paracoccaceae bacterium]